MKWILVVLLLILIPMLAGCIGHPEDKRQDWTVMVYMAGDNSLSDVVDANLEEMAEVGSSDGLKIVALADKAGEGDSHMYIIGRKQLIEQPVSNIWLKRPDEFYTGRYETLQSFVNWSIGNYSSSHYLLIMWGHGDGWKGCAEDKGDVLNLTEMKLALGDRKLDIIAFDACFMGAVEVYHALEKNADYIIASEKKIPRAGWPYGKILGHVKGHSPGEVGTLIVDHFIEAYEKGEKDNEHLSMELALLKTNAGFCEVIKNYLEGNPAVDMTVACRFEDEDSADVASVINDANVSRALSKTVVKIGKWDNPGCPLKVDDASGLAIYCPANAFDEAYGDTDFARLSGWVHILGGK